MTPHLLDLEKCVPPEGNLFVLVVPIYTIYKETRALRALCLLGCLSQLEEVQP
jgi:hypothetical protein